MGTGCLLDLDKTITLVSDPPTDLVKRRNQLLKKNVDSFSIEDLRFMVSQRTGLHTLVPLGIKYLDENVFAEGDFFSGDLLLSITSLEEDFWKYNAGWYKQLSNIIRSNLSELEELPLWKHLKVSVMLFLNLQLPDSK